MVLLTNGTGTGRLFLDRLMCISTRSIVVRRRLGKVFMTGLVFGNRYLMRRMLRCRRFSYGSSGLRMVSVRRLNWE